MNVTRLCTGWLHITFPGGYAQLPPDFGDENDTVPDEYIFKAEWNRDRVNRWWSKYRQLP